MTERTFTLNVRLGRDGLFTSTLTGEGGVSTESSPMLAIAVRSPLSRAGFDFPIIERRVLWLLCEDGGTVHDSKIECAPPAEGGLAIHRTLNVRPLIVPQSKTR